MVVWDILLVHFGAFVVLDIMTIVVVVINSFAYEFCVPHLGISWNIVTPQWWAQQPRVFILSNARGQHVRTDDSQAYLGYPPYPRTRSALIDGNDRKYGLKCCSGRGGVYKDPCCLRFKKVAVGKAFRISLP